ncbi:uncharacterized protein C6orf203 homolog [Copidosoma floridanum]|uniref:uncharacterized protein C6orf203 homolog n=1 Tax=Copidosoma floridanum TaxID=29053 RepID=UPI0006C9B090|nr:uncharacterized protein C6orf203 homolog [Copidosoma floridanum]
MHVQFSLIPMTLGLSRCTAKRLILPITQKSFFLPVRYKHDDKILETLDDEDTLALNQKKAKLINTTVSGMRLDAVLKAGLGVSRNKIEQAFYESRVRMNGQKAKKKGIAVNIGDILDLVNTERAPDNPKLINISRLKILDADLEGDKYRVQMIRDKSLIVEDETVKF